MERRIDITDKELIELRLKYSSSVGLKDVFLTLLWFSLSWVLLNIIREYSQAWYWFWLSLIIIAFIMDYRLSHGTRSMLNEECKRRFGK